MTGSPNGPTTTDVVLDELVRAATAHGQYEETGKADPERPIWYARHLAQTLGAEGYRLTRATP